MEQKSSGRNTAEGVNMPATPKTKAEIAQELFELSVVLSIPIRQDMGQFNETDWNSLYAPECDYNTALQYFNKWMGRNPYSGDMMDVMLAVAGSGLDGFLDTVKDEVMAIPEPQPETVYVVREEPVMSKLNLILSSC